MSRQLKYKLKKTLKNAEFVHADLEYHEELAPDALKGFQTEVSRLIAALSNSERQRLNEYLKSQLPPPIPERPEPSFEEEGNKGSDCTDMILDGVDPEAEEKHVAGDEVIESGDLDIKAGELKKLFRRIADLTHPDKNSGRGMSDEQIENLAALFRKARGAYESDNWYTLYTIAVELGLDIKDPSMEQVEWIEEDIIKTLAKIAYLSNLTAWHWYIGNEKKRLSALRHYFWATYNFKHPDL